mmetsp:Transcript_26072/g.41855  ORF Transcript_26072/g.41855 Transcript_26072/m.41855 type:complete len:234 (-) Transcript_26072:2659-3360(-)
MRHFILVQRFHRSHESCDEVMNESPVPRKGTSNHAVPHVAVSTILHCQRPPARLFVNVTAESSQNVLVERKPLVEAKFCLRLLGLEIYLRCNLTNDTSKNDFTQIYLTFGSLTQKRFRNLTVGQHIWRHLVNLSTCLFPAAGAGASYTSHPEKNSDGLEDTTSRNYEDQQQQSWFIFASPRRVYAVHSNGIVNVALVADYAVILVIKQALHVIVEGQQVNALLASGCRKREEL